MKPTIRIYGPIGGDSEDSVTTKSVSDALLSIGDAPEIEVRINSDGGSVRQGLAIHKMFADHPAKIHVIVEGAACSIAGFIAMVGDRRTICADSMFHYHGPRIYTDEALDEVALEDHSKQIKIATESMAARYAAVTGQTPESIKEAFHRDNFLDADESVAAGFMTHVGESSGMVARIDTKNFTVPKKFASAMAAKVEPIPKPGEKPMAAATIAQMEARFKGASADFLLKHHKAQSTLEAATDDYVSELVAENKLLARSNKALKDQMEAGDMEADEMEAETDAETIARLTAKIKAMENGANAMDDDDEMNAMDDDDDMEAMDDDEMNAMDYDEDMEAMDDKDDMKAELASLRAENAKLRKKKKRNRRTGAQAVNVARRKGGTAGSKTTAVARVTDEAKKLIAESPGMKMNEAKAQVFRSDDKLREAYSKEMSR